MMQIPLKDGTRFEPTEQDLSNWRQGFSRLDIEKELRHMAVWCEANPAKRKTPVGVRRFIVSWLNRAAQTGGSPDLATPDDVPESSAFRADEIFNVLSNVMGFFGRPIERAHMRMWSEALAGYAIDEIRTACDEHVKTGRYAPRPHELIAIMDRSRSAGAGHRGDDRKPIDEAPPEVAKAWMWYMRMAYGMDLYKCGKVAPEKAEEYLYTVNRQAFNSQNPDAILPEHRLQEIWG